MKWFLPPPVLNWMKTESQWLPAKQNHFYKINIFFATFKLQTSKQHFPNNVSVVIQTKLQMFHSNKIWKQSPLSKRLSWFQNTKRHLRIFDKKTTTIDKFVEIKSSSPIPVIKWNLTSATNQIGYYCNVSFHHNSFLQHILTKPLKISWLHRYIYIYSLHIYSSQNEKNCFIFFKNTCRQNLDRYEALLKSFGSVWQIYFPSFFFRNNFSSFIFNAGGTALTHKRKHC